MQIQVKTRANLNPRREPSVIMDVLFVPRGSGNRNKAKRLGEALRNHPDFAQDIIKVVVGCSRVTVHFRASLGLAKRMAEFQMRQYQAKDVEGQMALFGVT